MSQIFIEKKVFDKKNFSKVIDINFHQLLSNSTTEEIPIFTLEDFFNLYEQLFYQIPKEGDINSHNYILQKEADYLGINLDKDNIQALLEEITTLRQQVLDAQTTIKELSSIIK